MANVKITELTEIDASAVTDSDVLPIDDADGGPAVTYKISIGRLRTKVISPSSNGAESCGTSSLRWAAVYAQNLNVLSTSAPQAQLSYDASNHLQVSVSSAGAVTYNATGASAGHSFSDTAYIGDTSNADVTLGLTINQGAADDQILAFKSSDVAHGMTGVNETDTYGRVSKVAGADGGMALIGLTESTIALYLRGFATSDNSTKTSGGVAHVMVDAATKSGTSVGAPALDTNLFGISQAGTTAFLFDKEGTFHADQGSTTF